MNPWKTELFEESGVGAANHQNEGLRNLRCMDEIERQSGDGKDRSQEQRGEGAFLKLLSDRDTSCKRLPGLLGIVRRINSFIALRILI